MSQFRRLGALVVALLAMIGLSFAMAPQASAAGDGYRVAQNDSGFSVSGKHTGVDGKVDNVTVPTALMELRDARDAFVGKTYCIQMTVSVKDGAGYRESDWDTSKIANLPKVQWILNHSYPTVDLPDLAKAAGIKKIRWEQSAIAGTQAAIWHFTDGFELGEDNAPMVNAIYNYLITNAKAVDAQPPAHRTITIPSGNLYAGAKIGPIHVDSSDNKPVKVTVSGAEVKFVDTEVKAADMNSVPANSDLYFTAPPAAGSVTLEASSEVTIEAGRVFVKSKSQTLILAAQSKVADQVSVDIKWTVKPAGPVDDNSPKPTPSATPTQTPSADDAAKTSAPSASTPTAGAGEGAASSDPSASASAAAVVNKPALSRTGGEEFPVFAVAALVVGGALVALGRRKK